MNVFKSILEIHLDTRITTRSDEIGDIQFHEVCDPGIVLWENFTKATQTPNNLQRDGVCFMNRPMEFKQEVHLYGSMPHKPDKSFKEIPTHIKIGLTNIDPAEIHEVKYLKKELFQLHSEINCFLDINSFGIYCTHLCISLYIDVDGACTLFTRVN